MRLTADDRWRLQERAREALETARRSRYPVVLLLGLGEQMDAQMWSEFAGSSGLAVVDVLEEAREPDFRRKVGAWPTYVEWIREEALTRGGIFVLDIDAVATAWSESERRRFYVKLLKSETRSQPGGNAVPIVTASRLALEYDLPDDPRSYGIVVNLLS